MAWLSIEIQTREGSYRGRIRFAGKTLTIGRDRECDVPVGHSTVSGVHARIVRSGRLFRVEDAGSRNGILLNRIPVSTAAVHSGDVLTLGRKGPEVRLIEFHAGPAVLPRVLLFLLILVGTAAGGYAMRLERVEDWLSRARLWLPRYEGAKWFAAEIPVKAPAPPPEDPRTRDLPGPPTHFGDDPGGPGTRRELPAIDFDTPLADRGSTLPGSPESSAREALARTELAPPSLAGTKPGLSTRYIFAGVRRGVDVGTVNERLSLAKARLRATFPKENLLLIEVPESSPALQILRDSEAFGLLMAATEGAPGGVDARTQAIVLAALVESLSSEDPLPVWADTVPAGDRRMPVITRCPPEAGNRTLDIKAARIAATEGRVVVVYEMEVRYTVGGPGRQRRETRAFVFESTGVERGEARDLPIDQLPDDLRKTVEPILPLGRAEDE